MGSVSTQSIWKTSAALADGREIIYFNEAPGLGVDINETLAAKYPINNKAGRWTIRRRDGTIIRP